MNNLAKVNNPAAQLSFIYAFMKAQDPGSTVRESEFSTAAKTGDLPTTILAPARRILSGKLLDQKQVDEFLNAAKGSFKGYKENHEKLKSKYSDIAKQYELSPERIVSGFEYDEPVNEETISTNKKVTKGTTKSGYSYSVEVE